MTKIPAELRPYLATEAVGRRGGARPARGCRLPRGQSARIALGHIVEGLERLQRALIAQLVRSGIRCEA
jgi:hypothetical protein